MESTLLPQAQELAVRLDVPLELHQKYPASPGAKSDAKRLLLRLTHDGLELVKLDDRKLSGALRVDFTAGHAAFRRKQQKKELLVRAVGGKGRALLNIIDATGGLGRDSFLLAAAGHRVHIFEQQPVVAALLADGLERAATHPEAAEICTRIRFSAGDAVPALEALQEESREQCEVIDVVYLDPMFPERRKSALVKKELQMLQLLSDQDAAPERLLTAALKVATQRVVVKRPVKAPCLTELIPSYSLAGKTVRFDVYLGGLLSRK